MNRQGGENVEKTKEGIVAVIVGIDGYKNKPLHCAVNDAVYLAENLQKVWKNRKVKIKTLTWPSDVCGVTREAILAEVREYAGMADESDTFIFYFAGHGVCIGEEPALVAVADGKTAKGIEYINIKEIQQASAGCASHKKVMILDCCQGASRKNETINGYKNLETLTQGWSILISSSPGEVSLEDQYSGDSSEDYLQQGVFTAGLVEGLRGEAASGNDTVSLADLAYFVGKRVPVEYQERCNVWLKLGKLRSPDQDQEAPDTRGAGLNSQNPVLLCDAVAMGGPYRVVMAPEHVPAAHDARRKKPSKQFLKYWFKFLIKPWPIEFPFKLAFYLGGFLYAAAMVFTVLWNAQGAVHTIPVQVFSCVVGFGSVFLWWLTLPFAVAANEDYWHIGGYFTVLFYFMWHCIVVIGFIWIYSRNSSAIKDPKQIYSLIFEIFFLFVGVVIFACNASQTIIALAETLRSDDRRDIRQAIRVFQQFKYTPIGVDMYNYVAQVSCKPHIYFYGWIASIVFVGLSLFKRMAEIVDMYPALIIVREVLVMAMITWLVLWYYSAYKRFQQEVYKR